MMQNRSVLILGDIFALGLVIIIGFATHGETDLSFLPRVAATFFPLVLAWFLLAPRLGLFQDEVIHSARQLWRPALTALFAAPLAAVLRGLILNAPIIPIFAVVLGAVSSLGMVIWRALYFLLNRKARNGA
jgi:flagellar biosynthesis protein FliQ